MPKMTGAKALMEMLKAEGVEHIFGNPGTSESAIMDALEDYPELNYILTTQEGVAIGMADAYARCTGKPAFVNLHIDSGLANGVSLLTNAYEAGTPLVLTSGNKDVRKLVEGKSDLVEMVRQFTKWSIEVSHPDQVPGAIRRAFNEAKTPPTGPTYISFAANSLDDETEVDIKPSQKGFFRTRPDSAAIDEASNILASAESPVLIVGDRVARSGAVEEAVKLAELTGAKVYATQYSQMNFPTSHPQYLGMLNPTMPAGRAALESADAVIAVGTPVFAGYFHFDGSALGPNTKLIHIDSDANQIGKSEPTDVGVIGDPKMALADLSESIETIMTGDAREGAKGRAASIADEKSSHNAAWESRLNERRNMSPMSAERMMTEIANALPNNAILVDDAVTTRAAIMGAMEFDESDSLMGISGGALGWGMGGAMGAKLANPDRPIVAIVGDGSSMMTVQALWTAANANIPVVYVICNNQAYRVLKLNMNIWKNDIRQEDDQSKYLHMDFPIPLNIAGIAEAIGVYGQKIDKAEDIGPALKNAIALRKPAVLDISIDGSV